MQKPDEALAVLEKARARFKLSFPLEFYTAIAYSAAKKYSDALKYMISAEAIAKATEPSRITPVFLFQMGAAYERNGDIEEAEKYFRQCLQQAPDDAEALNYLGYMWAEHGVRLTEAHDLIEKAVRIKPDSAAFLDSLAWVLFKLDKPQEALPPMLKAIEHSEKPDATLYEHLGDIHAALKQFSQAREAWNKALALEPNPQIQKKLDGIPSSAPNP
jgi:tetratricopeptide (TPR) repeat protein